MEMVRQKLGSKFTPVREQAWTKFMNTAHALIFAGMDEQVRDDKKKEDTKKTNQEATRAGLSVSSEDIKR